MGIFSYLLKNAILFDDSSQVALHKFMKSIPIMKQFVIFNLLWYCSFRGLKGGFQNFVHGYRILRIVVLFRNLLHSPSLRCKNLSIHFRENVWNVWKLPIKYFKFYYKGRHSRFDNRHDINSIKMSTNDLHLLSDINSMYVAHCRKCIIHMLVIWISICVRLFGLFYII